MAPHGIRARSALAGAQVACPPAPERRGRPQRVDRHGPRAGGLAQRDGGRPRGSWATGTRTPRPAPRELHDKVKPFKDKLVEDIRQRDGDGGQNPRCTALPGELGDMNGRR